MNFIIIDIVLLLFIIISQIILFLMRKDKKVLKKNKTYNYAILIAARYESSVIEDTLKSIKKQNKNMSNVYVIIESKDDPTYEIAKGIGANVYVRCKPIKHTKGNALDECIKDILKKDKHYDLYFILDADNVIEKDFIKNMKKYWEAGYELASGYRNTSNPNTWVSLCSGLLFSSQNNLLNKYRSIFNRPITLVGSGYYIDGKIIEDLGGFPFYTLTEDYELSVYMEDNNISNIVAKDCVYYDEQPISIRSSIKQRTRWLKGIFNNNKKRKKTVPILLSNAVLVTTVILLFFLSLELILKIGVLKGILLIYIFVMLMTIVAFIFDNNKINANILQKIRCILLNPIFLLSYLICLINLLLNKHTTWEKINHVGNYKK